MITTESPTHRHGVPVRSSSLFSTLPQTLRVEDFWGLVGEVDDDPTNEDSSKSFSETCMASEHPFSCGQTIIGFLTSLLAESCRRD